MNSKEKLKKVRKSKNENEEKIGKKDEKGRYSLLNIQKKLRRNKKKERKEKRKKKE